MAGADNGHASRAEPAGGNPRQPYRVCRRGVAYSIDAIRDRTVTWRNPLRAALAALLLPLALSTCRPAYVDGEPNLDSPYFKPPTGSTLHIRQPVAVDAGRDRAYFQAGRRRAWHEVNEYRAYCALVLTDRADRERTIAPGRYRVEAVSLQHLFQLAGARARASPVSRRDEGHDGYHVLALALKLCGPDPRLEGLACARWGLPQGMPRVTVRVMREALGDRFALELASP